MNPDDLIAHTHKFQKREPQLNHSFPIAYAQAHSIQWNVCCRFLIWDLVAFTAATAIAAAAVVVVAISIVIVI